MKLPVIAIVGRPNVGKSTMFNRLAGRRIAIVSDVPGTTRDRVSMDASWRDRRFAVVDTGGIEDKPAASIQGTPAELWEPVRAQARKAMDEADGVILVVDATTGPLGPDTDVADMVRRCGKPWVVAVNKADSPARALGVHEFHSLGGEPFATSAYHGEGIDDMMSALMALVPRGVSEEIADPTPRVAIVGRPNVGKSALFNAITGSERAIVSPVQGTTRDPVDTPVSFDGREFVFIDTAGLRRRGHIEPGLEKFSSLRALQAIERCHVAVIVMDAQDFPTAQDQHVAGYVNDASRAAVLVVNKWDLRRQIEITEPDATLLVRRAFKFLPAAPVLFTSALTGAGLGAFPRIVLTVYDEFTTIIPTERLGQALAEAVVNRPPPSVPGRRVRITGIAQKRNAPPTFSIRTNAPELIHFSYRRYLENRFREAFGFTGAPLRIEFTTGDP